MLYGENQDITLENGQVVQGRQISIPGKKAVLRVPTGKETEAMVKAFIRKNKKKDPANADNTPYLDLFHTCRQDKEGDEFDEFEAKFVVDSMLSFRVSNAEYIENAEFEVTIKTPFADVIHYLRRPSFKEMATLGTVRPLYDALILRTEGYAEGFEVPQSHKDKAAEEIAINHNLIDPFGTDPNA